MSESTASANAPLSAEAAGRQLNVPGSTIKLWLSSFEMPGVSKNSRGWRIDSEGLAVLEAIKALRETGAGNETIRRKLDFELPVGGEAEPTAPADDDRQEAPVVSPSIDLQEGGVGERQLAMTVTEAIAKAVAEQTELAEKYARTAHHVGVLESRLDAREEALSEERQRREAAEARVAELEASLAADRQRLLSAVGDITSQQQELLRAARRPFWQRLWG